MKALIVYFTRTGNTQKVAKELAKQLNADIELLVEQKDRSGILGYMGAGRDATRKKITPISKLEHDVGQYDLVIVGTPIWVYTMASPVRTFLTQNKLPKVAFFCTHGGNHKDTFSHMEELAGKPVAVLDVRDKAIKDDVYLNSLKDFIEKL